MVGSLAWLDDGVLEDLLPSPCGDKRSCTMDEKLRLELIDEGTGMVEAGDDCVGPFLIEGAEKLGEGPGKMGDLGGVLPRPGSVCGDSWGRCDNGTVWVIAGAVAAAS